MADYDSVYCPKCKVGFAPDTAICPICKVPLTSEDEFEDEDREIPEPVIIEDDLSSLKKLRTADPAWIHRLQDRLAVAAIPHRIEQYDPPGMSFSIYVRPGDFSLAKDIDERVFAAEVPDGEGMPHIEDLDYSSCPGCGSWLGENDLKCSSCGLNLSPIDRRRCPGCDEVIEANVTVCPYCGYEIESSKT
ncbi:MAG TPA: zinc ribbon domain-containing protein [Thermodesulfobacteriota bacterium]|nr:zinc ribbon domain-containing protein [Thermodesulfobacteriota bacterium]